MNKSFITLFIALATVGCSDGSSVNGPLWLAAGEPELTGEPYYEYRILNHWDNLDDSVERGYAGKSMWQWTSDSIPEARIREYGRLNQSIGINGAVLNNVNASPRMLTPEIIGRVASIAEILRDYGMKTYISINFASPQALGELTTADPLDEEVIRWWNDKVDYIYSLIPDFGGFLVKACSEGQPGPQDFGRTHVDGANMLADAVGRHGGIVMWRAFVYAPDSPDRANQAYEEFVPLDGQFRDNVIIQIKNGPVDFQPREPVSPLFFNLHKTAEMPEFQITQEYLGQSKQLCYLGTMWEEALDTLANNGAPKMKAICGVANTGQDANWCGHIFAQANWYTFGRLAWDPTLSAEQIADEWLHLTFPRPKGCSKKEFESVFIAPVKALMMESRENMVDYMMPLGLHHIFASNAHYGPEPWYAPPFLRVDWTPPYYHKADSEGIGFDRTLEGSGNVAQYPEPLASQYNSLETCPENLLLWFHHVPWDYRMKSGRTLWEEMCVSYDRGLKKASGYRAVWASVRKYVNPQMWQEVADKLEIQYQDAVLWRDACVQYFQTFSGMEIPECVEQPVTPLDSIKRRHMPTSITS